MKQREHRGNTVEVPYWELRQLAAAEDFVEVIKILRSNMDDYTFTEVIKALFPAESEDDDE